MIKKISFHIFLFLALFFCDSVQFSSATIFDLNDTNNFHFRFEGAEAGSNMGWMSAAFGDVDNNGIEDMIINAASQDSNGANSGSVYIIFDNFLNNFTGKGNVLDTNDAGSYNLRIDGEVGERFGYFNTINDVNNDGLNELVVVAVTGKSVYIVPNSVLANITGKGNSFNMSDTTKWTHKIVTDQAQSSQIALGDYNGDGLLDLFTGDRGADNNGVNSGSVFIINNSLISDSTTGNIINTSNSSHFNVRIDGDGYALYSTFGMFVQVHDLDQDGFDDIVLDNFWYNGTNVSTRGQIMFILDDKIPKTGTGNIINTSNSSAYTARLLGNNSGERISLRMIKDLTNNSRPEMFIGRATTTDFFYTIDSFLDNYLNTGGDIVISTHTSNYTANFSGITDTRTTEDFNNDGLADIFAGDRLADYGGTDTGSAFLYDNSLFTNLTGTGNSFIANNTEYFLARWDGDDNSYAMYTQSSADLNNDGTLDFIFGTTDSSHNSRAQSGAMWVIFNFPHSINSSISSPVITNNLFTINGTINATNSVTNISNVQISINSEIWINCDATDGNFNEKIEDYFCTVDTLSMSDGVHTYTIRAKDQLIVYTHSSQYESGNFTIDKNPPVISFSCDKTKVSQNGEITCTCTATDIVDNAPSVSFDIHPNTEQVGTHTTTCTSTDDQSYQSQSAISYTVANTRTSSGSGSTSTEIENPIQYAKFDNANPKKIMNIFNDKISFRRITFDTESQEVKLIIKALTKNKPLNLIKLQAKVYQYVEIEHEGIVLEEPALIEFRVEKEWIKNQDYNSWEIMLLRFSNKWNDLKTEFVNEDSNYYYFKSETPGFTYFAIQLKEKINDCPICPQCTSWSECESDKKVRICYECNIDTGKCDPINEEQECVSTKQPVDENIESEIQEKKEAKVTRFAILIIFMTLIVVGSYTHIKTYKKVKKRKKKEKP